MSKELHANEANKRLINLIRKFKKSKSPEVLHQAELDIILSAVSLDDQITILTSCPSGSVPFINAKNNLIETIQQRPLDTLVKIFEGIRPGEADEIRSLALATIIKKSKTNEQWIVVMDAIQFPGHELSTMVFETLMERPQDRLTIFKLHRLTADKSEEREMLEKTLILPYLEELAEEHLIDIVMVSAPRSTLMKEAQKILDRIMA